MHKGEFLRPFKNFGTIGSLYVCSQGRCHLVDAVIINLKNDAFNLKMNMDENNANSVYLLLSEDKWEYLKVLGKESE